jgi:hypothetical protein
VKKKLFIVLGFLLVLGFFFTACSSDDNSSDDPFKGTWVSNSNAGDRFIAENRSLKVYVSGIEALRGTYTVSGNAVNGKWTQVNPGAFGATGSWMNFTDLDSTSQARFGGENFTIPINGNTCTWRGTTLTKQ